MSQLKMMGKLVLIMILHFATLRMEASSLTIWGPTQAPALQLTIVSADKMTSVPNSLVERGRETVMMTLNVKDHLFVDTQIASTVHQQTAVPQCKYTLIQSE